MTGHSQTPGWQLGDVGSGPMRDWIPKPKYKTSLPMSDANSAALKAVGSGRGHPWAKQMSLIDFCKLKAGPKDGNPELGAFCDALKKAGYDTAKIDAVEAGLKSRGGTLEGFFPALLKALNVIVELRIRNEENAQSEIMEFNNGMKMSYPNGIKIPSRDETLIVHLTLRHNGENWEWDFPARRIGVDWVRPKNRVVIDLLCQLGASPANRNERTKEKRSSGPAGQPEKTQETPQFGLAENNGALEPNREEPDKPDTVESSSAAKGSLGDHKYKGEPRVTGEVTLKASTGPSVQHYSVEGDPLCADGKLSGAQNGGGAQQGRAIG